VLKSSKYSFRKFKKQPERKGVKKSSKEPFRKFYYNDVNGQQVIMNDLK